MDNFGFLFAAYTIIFAVIFLYVVFLWRRQARLDLELRGLETRLRQVQEDLASRLPPRSRSAS
ncbi:MAG TPA: CcmD family protein [Candidatus Binataceae bacterium]|nr:CcmD family protein [Candidatus Binataceae bacterium]